MSYTNQTGDLTEEYLLASVDLQRDFIKHNLETIQKLWARLNQTKPWSKDDWFVHVASVGMRPLIVGRHQSDDFRELAEIAREGGISLMRIRDVSEWVYEASVNA